MYLFQRRKDRERLARAIETTEKQEATYRLARQREQDRAGAAKKLATETAEEWETRFAQQRHKTELGQLRGGVLYLPDGENKSEPGQSQESSRNSWSCFAYPFPHCSASWWHLPGSPHKCLTFTSIVFDMILFPCWIGLQHNVNIELSCYDYHISKTTVLTSIMSKYYNRRANINNIRWVRVHCA